MVKSTAIKTNYGCFGADVETNLSCACIDGYQDTTEWTIRLRKPQEPRGSQPLPTTLSGNTVLEVDSMLLMGIPATVQNVQVANLNLNGFPIKPSSLPSTLRQLTLRNCNLTRLTSDVLYSLQDLAYL
ncbi:hypothetical protein ATCC90586_010543 [Pythium insidiosum]|nr:hypothetical protein ATCC90586_010543 [Pythium insidiosum]